MFMCGSTCFAMTQAMSMKLLVWKLKVSYSWPVSLQSSLESPEHAGDAFKTLTICTALPHIDLN